MCYELLRLYVYICYLPVVFIFILVYKRTGGRPIVTMLHQSPAHRLRVDDPVCNYLNYLFLCFSLSLSLSLSLTVVLICTGVFMYRDPCHSLFISLYLSPSCWRLYFIVSLIRA